MHFPLNKNNILNNSYVYISSLASSPGSKSKGLAERIQISLVAMGFVDRGVKVANWWHSTSKYRRVIIKDFVTN